MGRAPFQILVLPYRRGHRGVQYAIFRRADSDVWQGIAGGGENGESPAEAARRESLEEAALPRGLPLTELDTTSSIPVTAFAYNASWGDKVYVIPEYCFGIDVQSFPIVTSKEHTEFRWADYSEARSMLRYDSNKTALWELNQKMHGLAPWA